MMIGRFDRWLLVCFDGLLVGLIDEGVNNEANLMVSNKTTEMLTLHLSIATFSHLYLQYFLT